MAPRLNLRASAQRSLTAVFAVGCLAAAMVPSDAWGAVDAGEGDLSMRLAQLAKPSVRSDPPRKQAKALGLPASGPGSLLRRGNRVLVEVQFDHGALSSLDDLRAAGMRIVHASRGYQTVTVAAKPVELTRLNRIGQVRSAREVLTPILRGESGGGPIGSALSPPCFGADTSEGDQQLRADEARAKFAVDGNGFKVGVLSDSFNRDPTAGTNAADDVASGDLPGSANPCGHLTPVEVLDDLEGEGADEGRAMTQIVHDLAPGTELAFATAFGTESGFADNIRALAKAGAKMIVDDVSYLEEPFFQEGQVGVAISEVTEKDDVAYFSAAGNDNLTDEKGNNIGSWEAPQFRKSPDCPATLAPFGVADCMDFDPGPGLDNTFGITVEPGDTLLIDLQWAEPWFGVKTDLDAFLLDSEGNLLEEEFEGEMFAVGSFSNNLVTQKPFEFVAWENPGDEQTVQLVINRCSLTCNPAASPTAIPRLKFILVQNGGGVSEIEYPEPSEKDIVGPTIFGHGGGEDTMSIGAIRYNRTTEPERFSSWGPVTHYFKPVAGPLPAEELKAPQELSKPDVVATDGGANTFFPSCKGTIPRFFGTSAAAPHAAAVAALERNAKPTATALEIKEAQINEALAVGGFPVDAVGSGMVNAVGAIETLIGAPPSPEAEPPPPPGQAICLATEEPVTPLPLPTPIPPITPPSEPLPVPDTTAPETFFLRHPSHTIRTATRRARAVFRFGSDEANVEFLCRIDRGAFRRCGARIVRRFTVGRHVVRVKARDAAGNEDATPAVFRFKVRRRG